MTDQQKNYQQWAECYTDELTYDEVQRAFELMKTKERMEADSKLLKVVKDIQSAQKAFDASKFKLKDGKLESIEQTLEQRGANYGEFRTQAYIAQQLKDFVKLNCSNEWSKLEDFQQEAIEMIFHKIARILNGNPNYIDSWFDICGYSQLVVNELKGEKNV